MKKILIAIVITMVLATTVIATNYDSMIKPKIAQVLDIGQYHTKIDIYVNGELWDSVQNLWTYEGRNATSQYLGNAPGAAAFKNMTLGNTTDPAVDSATHPGEIGDCGLETTAGLWQRNGDGEGEANWSIGHQWTSSCDGVKVNTTGLYNDSSTTYFAGTTFTDANLNSGDKLTVNYTIWIT